MELTSVLVTGGCGFVGGRIIQHLQERHPKCRIVVFDNKPKEACGFGDITYVQTDITSSEEVRLAFRSFDAPFQVVFHVAGMSPPLSERYARRIHQRVLAINVEGTRNILEAALENGTQAFVYTSSICAVTDDFSQPYANIDERWPLVEAGKGSSYGESKAMAEKLVLGANRSSLRTCAIRPAVIFGEGDYQLVPGVVNCIIRKDESPYRLGDGTNMWDTVYVGNVADAHILAAENLLSPKPTAAGEAIFITNNEPVSCRDFMLFCWNKYNGHVPAFEIGVPLKLAWFVGMVCEMYTWLTGTPSTLSRGSVNDATAIRYFNGAKSREILGYKPRIGLEEGLNRTCKWLYARNTAAEKNQP